MLQSVNPSAYNAGIPFLIITNPFTIPPAVLFDPEDPKSQPPPPPDPLEDPTVRVDVALKHAQARKAMADAAKTEVETLAILNPPVLPPDPQQPPPEAYALPPQPMPPPGMTLPPQGESMPPL